MSILGKVISKGVKSVVKKAKTPKKPVVKPEDKLPIELIGGDLKKDRKIKKRKKKKRDTPKEKIGGRLVQGAGDMSEPGGVGNFRTGQKKRRSGSSKTSTEGMSTTEKGRLAREKSARGSKAFYEQAVKDKKEGKTLTAAQKDSLKNYPKEMRPPSSKRKVSKKKSEEKAREATTLNPRMETLRLNLKKRKTGGQVMKKAGGGKMSHVGLYPAEEARSGTMSEKKRAQNMGHGGKIKKYKHGGKVNTSRENRLEELGRVDAEKAHTSKGKRNLRQEKKRIVRELNGNDFVAQYYD